MEVHDENLSKEEEKSMSPLPELALNGDCNSNGIEVEIFEWKKAKKIKNPDPIEIARMPTKSNSDSTEIDYLHALNKWIKSISPSIVEQEALHFDPMKKQIVAIFDCSDCVNMSHRCFICKKREKKVSELVEYPKNCNSKQCGKYYHRSCLLEDSDYAKHTEFYQNGNILCPRHHCWSCQELQTLKVMKVQRKCWFCPRSYHRNCSPTTAQLLSVQETDSNEMISKYPDFRYDLISCRWNDVFYSKLERLNPPHPEPRDLTFGRNDAKNGIFKWTLWNSSIATFYRLDDDPFSIDIKMLNEYKKKREKSSQNSWRKSFKTIKKSKYSKEYLSYLKKERNVKNNNIDYGECECSNGCSLDSSCYNYSMEIECNSENCGSREAELCENRQFEKIDHDKNVEIKLTENTGFGAFAKRDLAQNELIIEYVGEVITKKEANARIKELNHAKATNFYFFQVDAKTVIDGTSIGNISRFLNHSCSANCHTMKWNVCGHHRLGIFASVDIKKGEQLTYDYQFEVENVDDVDKLAQCLCGSKQCRFYLGFNKKKAIEWKEKLKKEGNYMSPCSDSDEEEEKHRRRKKKKKKKKKRSKKKKKRSKKKEKDDENDDDKENGKRNDKENDIGNDKENMTAIAFKSDS